MIIEVIDWNMCNRYYEMEDEKVTEMMTLPRKERKEFFRSHTKMARIHCDIEATYNIPIYVNNDDDSWDEFEDYFYEQ